MPQSDLFAGTTVLIGIVTLIHAAFTWPVYATVAFFGGGALIAFIGEAVVINLDWLEHHIGPKVTGVPLYVLFGWTATVYIAFRAALLVTNGWLAVAATAVLATTYDILTDHQGVSNEYWSYTNDLPGPRYRGVPWWNFLGWFAVSCLTAAVALPFL